jgi:hypothetical protein
MSEERLQALTSVQDSLRGTKALFIDQEEISQT